MDQPQSTASSGTARSAPSPEAALIGDDFDVTVDGDDDILAALELASVADAVARLRFALPGQRC